MRNGRYLGGFRRLDRRRRAHRFCASARPLNIAEGIANLRQYNSGDRVIFEPDARSCWAGFATCARGSAMPRGDRLRTDGRHELSSLFLAGNDVLTEIRLTRQGGRSEK